MSSSKKVIWRHPRGRFVVVESSGTNQMGTPYRIREAILTPEHDRRGQINAADSRKRHATK